MNEIATEIQRERERDTERERERYRERERAVYDDDKLKLLGLFILKTDSSLKPFLSFLHVLRGLKKRM